MNKDGKRTDPLVTDAMRNEIDALRAAYRNKRRMIAECKVNVTAFMDGTIENWPRNIQDGVYAALERTSLGRGYTIRVSYCDRDWDAEGEQYFLHIIATGEATVQ